MRRTLLISCLLLGIIETAIAEQTGVITGERVRIYKKPTIINSETVGYVNKGNTVTILEIFKEGNTGVMENYWYKIKFEKEKEGWVLDQYVKPNLSLSSFHLIANYNLLGKRINAIEFDRKGNLWVGTTKGIFILDKEGNIQKTYTTKNGLKSNEIFSIIISNSYSWVATKAGIEQYDFITNTWKCYTYRGYKYRTILYETADSIWIVNRQARCGGPIRFDKKKKEFEYFNEKQPFANAGVSDIIIVDNIMWVPTEKGLLKFNKSTGAFNFFKPSNVSYDYWFLCIEQDKYTPNLLYIGGYRGLYIYDTKKEIWGRIGKHPSGAVTNLYQNGNLLYYGSVGKYGSGAAHGLGLKVYNIENGELNEFVEDTSTLIDNRILALNSDGKDVYIGTSKGLNIHINTKEKWIAFESQRKNLYDKGLGIDLEYNRLKDFSKFSEGPNFTAITTYKRFLMLPGSEKYKFEIQKKIGDEYLEMVETGYATNYYNYKKRLTQALEEYNQISLEDCKDDRLLEEVLIKQIRCNILLGKTTEVVNLCKTLTQKFKKRQNFKKYIEDLELIKKESMELSKLYKSSGYDYDFYIKKLNLLQEKIDTGEDKDGQALFEKARIYKYELMEFNKAIEAFEKYIENSHLQKYPSYNNIMNAYYEIGEIYEVNYGNYKKALEVYKTGIFSAFKLYRNRYSDFSNWRCYKNSSIYLALEGAGYILAYKLGAPQDAINFYNTIIEEYPKNKEFAFAGNKIKVFPYLINRITHLPQ